MQAFDILNSITAPAVARSARLAGIDASGRLLVRLEGSRGEVPARIGLALDDTALRAAAAKEEPALVIIPEDPGALPIVIAVVRDRVEPARPKDLIKSQEELTIRCGKASITLRKDGRVVIRGTHVISASSGPQKIKGASIALN